MSQYIRISEDDVVSCVTEAPSLDWCVKYIGGTWKEISHPDNFPYGVGVGYVWDEDKATCLPPRDNGLTDDEYAALLENARSGYFMNKLKVKRNQLLDITDKYVTTDYSHVTEDIKQAYVDYRQALRDLPANTEDPENPTWPTLALPTEIDPMDILRRKRNELLRKTDHLAFPDYPHLSDQVRADWMAYRQALRDLPANTTDPENPTWPTEPSYE